MIIENVLKIGIIKLKEKNIENYQTIAKTLLAHTLGVDKNYLLVHNDKTISKKDEYIFYKNIRKIVQGRPLQYITNTQYFFGNKYYVNKNVLIPQPDTENLIVETLKILETKRNLKVLDLCTGSGAIVTTLAKEKPNNKYFASDISKKALMVAKINSKNLNTNVKFIRSNLFSKINEKFNIIVSNPPYIKTNVIKTLPKDVQKEPYIALDGGEDGLKFYNKIIAKAPEYLENNGYLVLEIGYDQKEEVIEILKKNNFENIKCIKDLSKNDRVIISNYKVV